MKKIYFNSKKIEEYFNGTFLLIFVLALFYAFPSLIINAIDWGFLTNEITAYHEYCIGGNNDDFCISHLTNSNLFESDGFYKISSVNQLNLKVDKYVRTEGSYNIYSDIGTMLELREDKYQLYPNTQTVVWTDGLGDIQKLSNCEIFNRKNWTCNDNKNTEEGFSNGNYFIRPMQVKLDNKGHFYTVKTISRWQWEMLSCNNNKACAVDKYIFNK